MTSVLMTNGYRQHLFDKEIAYHHFELYVVTKKYLKVEKTVGGRGA
jgi:hypothetical protein